MSASTPLLHHLTLVTPWFECTRDGRKKMEGRMRRSVPLVQAGDWLRIGHATEDRGVRLRRRVTRVRHHVDFARALEAVALADALPGVDSAAEGAGIYERFYPADAQLDQGVVWIETEALSEAESDQAADAADAAVGRQHMAPPDFDAVIDARRRMRSQLEEQWEAQQQQQQQSQQSQPSAAAVTTDNTVEADAEARAQRRQQMESFVQERMDQLHREEAATQPPPRRALSLWLQAAPGSDVAGKLESSVAALSAAHGQAPFPPHVTLATFPWAGEAVTPVASVIAGVERALAAVLAPGERSLRVHGSQLGTHPSLPFVTLVLLLERSAALLALRTAVFQQLEDTLKRASPGPPAAFPRCFPYMPHLSLLYDTRASLSPLEREHALEQECEWDGVRGRGAFRGIAFDIGTVALVETTARDYSQWPLLGRVSVPTGLAAQMEPLVALPAEAVPPCPSRDEDRFRREVLDRLDHALYLRLCFARAAEAARALGASASSSSVVAATGAPSPLPSGAALVCDGEVVWSAGGRVDPSTGDHVSAEIVLLREASAIDAAFPVSAASANSAAAATAVPFFSPSRLARMVLYCSLEPCAISSAAIAARGIRSVVFGLSQSRLQQLSGSTVPSSSSHPAQTAQPALLRVGPLLEDEASAIGDVTQRSL